MREPDGGLRAAFCLLPEKDSDRLPGAETLEDLHAVLPPEARVRVHIERDLVGSALSEMRSIAVVVVAVEWPGLGGAQDDAVFEGLVSSLMRGCEGRGMRIERLGQTPGAHGPWSDLCEALARSDGALLPFAALVEESGRCLLLPPGARADEAAIGPHVEGERPTQAP